MDPLEECKGAFMTGFHATPCLRPQCVPWASITDVIQQCRFKLRRHSSSLRDNFPFSTILQNTYRCEIKWIDMSRRVFRLCRQNLRGIEQNVNEIMRVSEGWSCPMLGSDIVGSASVCSTLRVNRITPVLSPSRRPSRTYIF